MSDYAVSLVPPEILDALEERVRPYLTKAAEFTFGRYEPEDIMQFVRSGNAHLWVALRDDNVIGITVTRFWEYPRKRCLDVVFLGGEDWDGWKDRMFDMLDRWSQDSGCDAIEASGRTGFARVFKDRGYTPLWQVFEFPVTQGAGG